MDLDDHLGQIQADTTLLAGAAHRAGWDAPVPSLEWTVRDLVLHTGGVHRWAADVVAHARDTLATEAGRAVGTGPADDELLEWFTAGAAHLIETLRSAPPDLSCATFLRNSSPRAFWARRQAHETAIHRVDAQAAAGEEITPFAPAFAEDGIAELLQGFAARSSNAIARAATVALRADDAASWVLTFGGERTSAERADVEDADLVVAGSASDLYCWLWNRPSAARLHGDESLAQAWAETVRVRWS